MVASLDPRGALARSSGLTQSIQVRQAGSTGPSHQPHQPRGDADIQHRPSFLETLIQLTGMYSIPI